MLAGVWTSTLRVTQSGGGTLFGEGDSLDRGIAAAKDGSSVCVFSRYSSSDRAPFLVLPSSLDDLAAKGRRRMEKKE
jgi:hypothetical protein